MIRQFYQCCYTHVSREMNDGIISTAWETVAVSPELPETARQYCTKVQSVHSQKVSGMVDEQGNPLDLYELCGDGQYLYLIRTQFGGMDFGRGNMFSHAFVIPWNDVETDLSSFLSIARSNFSSNEKDAERFIQEFEKKKSLTLDEAMHNLGLTEKTYACMLRCVYAQLSQKAPHPLYIQYDGSEEQMDAVIYCVLAGLPSMYRKTISIASSSCNTEAQRNIVFSTKARQYPQFLDPITGDNNILMEMIKRKIKSLGFVDYPARLGSEAEVNDYYLKLDSVSRELGGTSIPNPRTLKVAHQLITDDDISLLENEELERRFSDALSAKSSHSTQMEQYIASLLVEVYSRNVFFTEANDEILAEKLLVSTDPGFIHVGEQYLVKRLLNQPESSAIQHLKSMSEESRERYTRILCRSEAGAQLLDHYYSLQLEDAQITWESLEGLQKESALLSNRPKTEEFLFKNAYELVSKEMRNAQSCADSLQRYVQFLQLFLSDSQVSICDYQAKKAYWGQKQYSDFSSGSYDEYKLFHVPDVKKSEVFLRMCDLAFSSASDDSWLIECNRFYCEYQRDLSMSEMEIIHRALIKESLVFFNTKDKYFKEWSTLSYKVLDRALYEEIFVLRKALQMGALDEVKKSYYSFLERAERSTDRIHTEKTVSELGRTIRKILVEEDSMERPVSLDAWLLLGEMLYENPFVLFSNTETFITTRTPYDVVSGSKDFNYYYSCAEEYVNNKEAEYKTVKSWIKEWDHLNKKHVAESVPRPPQQPQEGQTGHKNKKRGLSSFFGNKQ